MTASKIDLVVTAFSEMFRQGWTGDTGHVFRFGVASDG